MFALYGIAAILVREHMQHVTDRFVHNLRKETANDNRDTGIVRGV